MHRLLALGVVVLSLLFVGGCGEEKIDASSKTAFDKSTEQIINSLPTDEKKDEFIMAIQTLMMKHVLFAGGGMSDEAGMLKKLKDTFHGKTADQIIAEAKKAKAENDAEMKKLLEDK